MKITDKIAKTIQKADKSYFFENYTKQAEAVLAMLDRQGYAIIEKEPTEEMLNAGEKAILPGKVKPLQLAEGIYKAMAKEGKIK